VASSRGHGQIADTQDIANIGDQSARMPTSLAGEDLHQGGLLALRSTAVKVNGRFPLHGGHIAWTMNRQRHIQIIEVNTIKAAIINVPGYQHSAIIFRRIAEEDTRASSLTVAGFKIRSIYFPFLRHFGSP
jgi:hypothetical protein